MLLKIQKLCKYKLCLRVSKQQLIRIQRLSNRELPFPRGSRLFISFFKVLLFHTEPSISDNLAHYPSTYNAQAVESNIYEWWKQNGHFDSKVATAKEKNQQKPFSMVLPPPNVTGHLHLGHALTATVQDALVRW